MRTFLNPSYGARTSKISLKLLAIFWNLVKLEEIEFSKKSRGLRGKRIWL